MNEITYTLKDMCEILKLHYQTVLKLLRTKKLNGFKAGREWRITHRDLLDFIERGKNERRM